MAFYKLFRKEDPRLFTCVYNKSHFDVVYKSPYLVRHVQYNCNIIKPNIRLSIANIENNVNIGSHIYDRLNLDLGNVYYNPCAYMIIDKKSIPQKTYQKALADQLSYYNNIEKIKDSDLLLFPFVKNRAIIIIHDTAHEDDTKITMNAQLFFPDTYLDTCVYPLHKQKNKLKNVIDKKI